MNSLLAFVLLLPILPLATAARPKVELYYETLCPYSRSFYLQQLEPVYGKLSSYIDVEVIPFGNVKVASGPDGIPLFTCQHGAAECYGNRVQACVIHLAANWTTSLAYVKCVFEPTSWKDTYTNSPRCADQVKPDWWMEVKECTDGQQGFDLIVANWKRTAGLVPKHNYVPWIVIDGVHTEELQEAAQSNLLAYLCANQLAGQNVPACAASKGKPLLKANKESVTFA